MRTKLTWNKKDGMATNCFTLFLLLIFISFIIFPSAIHHVDLKTNSRQTFLVKSEHVLPFLIFSILFMILDIVTSSDPWETQRVSDASLRTLRILTGPWALQGDKIPACRATRHINCHIKYIMHVRNVRKFNKNSMLPHPPRLWGWSSLGVGKPGGMATWGCGSLWVGLGWDTRHVNGGVYTGTVQHKVSNSDYNCP